MIGDVQHGWRVAKWVLACAALILSVGSARATTRYWTGAGDDALASNDANWRTDTSDASTTGAPVAGDDVVFDSAGDGKACTWDLDVALGSWTQNGYTSTVTIKTVFGETGFTCLTINGDVDLQSGSWTHVANTTKTETYRLCVSCGGDFTLGENASVTAKGKGFSSGGWGGPVVSSSAYFGSAHGGRGWHGAHWKTLCYGSIAEPERIGSNSDTHNGTRSAGGAIRFVVTGSFQIDGTVNADGNECNGWWSGSGGSVWLTANAITGSGAVSANGGWCSNSYQGGGGRVSLVQTGTATDFSAYTGTLSATGGRHGETGSPYAGAGTIYEEVASDGRGKGTLIVDAANPDLQNAPEAMTDIYLADQIAGFCPKKLIARNKARVIIDLTSLEVESIALPIAFEVDASSIVEITGAIPVDLSGASFARDGSSGAGTVSLTGGLTVELPENLSYENVSLSVGEGCSVSNATIAVGGVGALTTTGDATVTCDSLTLGGSSSCSFGEGASLAIETVLVKDSATFSVSGAVDVDCDTLTFQDTATGVIDGELSVPGNVLLKTGSKLTHTRNGTEEVYKLALTVGGDLTIDEGAAIDVSGKGRGGIGVKSGPGSDLTKSVGSAHGGCSYYDSSKKGAGVCYGSIVHPFSVGSGISQDDYFSGGAAKVSVEGTLTLNGSILAYGAVSDGAYAYYFGTSGGSVWITARALVGTTSSSVISASAAPRDHTYAYNLSGGGRVAVHLTGPSADFDDYAGTITSYGSKDRKSTHFYAGAGTVYLRKGSEAETGGTLIVDNGITASNETGGDTEISTTVLDKEVGSVIVRNGAVLSLLDGERLTVNGDVTNGASIVTGADSGFVFAGSGTSHILSDLALAAFVCLTPGKEIVFANGKTLTISAGGRLQVEGSDDDAVVLKSDAEGSVWNLAVDASAAQSVSRVSVADCDASGGAQIAAVNSTLTNTTNWKNTIVVYGQIVRWTGGAGSSSWLAAGNWDVGRAPLATDRLVIDPADVAPIVSEDFSALELTVSSGATLDLGGHTLTLEENVTLAGRVVSDSVGKIVAAGTVDCTGGSCEIRKIDLELAGSGAAKQLFNCGSCAFNRVTVQPNAAGVRLTGNVTSEYFICETDEAFALEIDPGKTLKVGTYLAFVGDGAVLTLKSSTVGEAWFIDCPGIRSLSGLAVSDSTSVTGILRADDSTNDGNNTNWDFTGSKTVAWEGTVSTDFHTAGNWSTGVVPDSEDNVVIGEGTVVADAAVSVATLRLKSGSNVSLNSAATIAGTLLVESGATLSHSANGDGGGKKISATIGGDFVLEDGASVDLNGKGYPISRGPSWSSGQGGGTHGGRAITHPDIAVSADKTYGSILWPIDLGSGGYTDTRGGGAAAFTVAGQARIDGAITASGESSLYYGGSGGSIALKARELVGSGSLEADGGSYEKINYVGGGGRIAVILTGAGADFSSFAGSIHAYSGCNSGETTKKTCGAPGTVYRETAADVPGHGTVTIDNSDSYSTAADVGKVLVDYPVLKLSPGIDEARRAKFVLKSRYTLNVVTNAYMADLDIQSDDVRINLNGHRLKIRAPRPATWPKDGSLPSFVIPGTDAAGNPGQIIWKQGLAIFFR